MKRFNSILISFLTITILFTTSCKKEIENVENPNQVQESTSVESILNSLQSGSSLSINGNITQGQVSYGLNNYFCFDFVYPISVMFSDGSVQSFTNNNEFAQAIVNQTQSYQIINFIYPFDINKNGSIITINNDTDFIDAINDCDTLSHYVLGQTCFDFMYPVSVEMNDGSIMTVNNLQGFELLFALGAPISPVDMVYPFDYIKNGNTYTIANAVEFLILLDNCN